MLKEKEKFQIMRSAHEEYDDTIRVENLEIDFSRQLRKRTNWEIVEVGINVL